jgi:two-component system response regulator
MNYKTILLIEDDPDDEALTLLVLERSKIRNKVFVVRDGAEALDFLFCTNKYADRDPHDLPQLILLDIKLPKMDGLEVLRRLRADKRTNLLPVIILTSSKEEQDVVEAYKSGANSYVRKPVDFNQFAESVRELGMYWLVLNEAPPR